MTQLAGPLLALSFRRVGHHCGKRDTPTPMDNEQRLRALRQVWPVTLRNEHNWPLKRGANRGE